MKTGVYRNLLVLFIALGCSLEGSSQIYNVYNDSLTKYLEIAAKNNPAVLQKFSEYRAALQKIPQAGSLPDPELTLGVLLKPMELVNGNQVADFRLMQMFPWFGVLKNAKDEMSLMANAKFELFRDAKLQVYYDVQRTWNELYKIQKEIIISEKNIEILKMIERLALVKFKTGSAETSVNSSSGEPVSPISSGSSAGMQTMSPAQGNTASAGSVRPSMQSGAMGTSSGSSGLVDVFSVQIESGDLEDNIALLKNQKTTVMAQFNAYLNRPSLSPVFTYENMTPDSLELSLVAIPDSILLNNPMLSMLDFERQSFEARERMVAKMGYPMVGLGLDYTLISKTQYPMGMPSMNGKDMIMPMVVLTIPVYRKKYNAMKEEAGLLKTAASQNYQATSNSLQVEYYQAVQSYEEARRRIKLYENQYQLSSKSFDLVLKGFSSSSSSLSDVLRARQQTLSYELKKVEAVTDLNNAIALLKRLMASSQIK